MKTKQQPGFCIALLMLGISIAPAETITENFDSYTAGIPLDGQTQLWGSNASEHLIKAAVGTGRPASAALSLNLVKQYDAISHKTPLPPRANMKVSADIKITTTDEMLTKGHKKPAGIGLLYDGVSKGLLVNITRQSTAQWAIVLEGNRAEGYYYETTPNLAAEELGFEDDTESTSHWLRVTLEARSCSDVAFNLVLKVEDLGKDGTSAPTTICHHTYSRIEHSELAQADTTYARISTYSHPDSSEVSEILVDNFVFE